MTNDFIKIRGARQHNLKNINVDIPKYKLVVLTGVSGSGKSSLAFDTIYAEGQRRYVESLSSYARQFLGVMDKPDVDSIEGLSPSISIDQKTTSRNPRSTVGTITEIYDYLRLLYARIGHPHCPICGDEIRGQSVDEITESVIKLIKDYLETNPVIRFFILSPIVRDKKGEFSSLFENLRSKGISYVRIDRLIKDINEDFLIIKTNKHNIDALIDRVSLTKNDLKNKTFVSNLKSRITNSISTTLKLSDGLSIISIVNDKSLEFPKNPLDMEDHLYSENYSCPKDNIQLSEIEPRIFSFNSPHGACPTCSGIGKILKIDKNSLFANDLSIKEGGILPFSNIFEQETWYSRLILKVCEDNAIEPTKAIGKLSESEINILLNGTDIKEYKVGGTNRFGRQTFIFETFPGIINELERRHKTTESDWVRIEIEKYMKEQSCPSCMGLRLRKESLSITIGNLSISQLCKYSITESISWFNELVNSKTLTQKELNISENIIKEIFTRLKFLESVGVDYLSLERSSSSLSGGESQRIRLASQIGTGLTGVLYVLDEPTIGLHQKDNEKLINTLHKLRDLGNSIIVVEHDKDIMKKSDYIFDFGPGAGKYGGNLVDYGNPDEFIKKGTSLTAKYLNGSKSIQAIKTISRYTNDGQKYISIKGCSQFNLKNIDVKFPLGKLVLVTGVSGSGKSTLLVETLFSALSSRKNTLYKGSIGAYREIEGDDEIDKIILIDQSPIGRTPRSNPATYTKIFDLIRDVFSQTKDLRAMGFKKGRFSFNVKGGRCESCEGQGQIKIEMQFMSDIWITCDVCKGKRYNSQTLEIAYKGKNISEILEMSVEESIDFFHNHESIITKLNTLKEVGLGYIELGQSALTLSGGEAQRVKLSSELSKKSTGKTVYILDEPTTGLHFWDIQNLLNVLRILVNRGNSVFIIEHNIDVIKNSDWIIDLGPDGGEKGGFVTYQGEYNDFLKNAKSYTADFLRNSI